MIVIFIWWHCTHFLKGFIIHFILLYFILLYFILLYFIIFYFILILIILILILLLLLLFYFLFLKIILLLLFNDTFNTFFFNVTLTDRDWSESDYASGRSLNHWSVVVHRCTLFGSITMYLQHCTWSSFSAWQITF